MLNPRHLWQEMLTSFWFVPGVVILGHLALATALIYLDVTVDIHGVRRWPLLFGAGAAGARGLLTAVAGSMVTVAGVVFSITLVALSMTSSQYTSRVLRNFRGDRVNQTVLGVFVGIFAYCLVVLRTIRGGDEGAFVPSMAVIGALVLALVGIAVLIYFIHHISVSIQASSIIVRASRETMAAVDRLFPSELGDPEEEDDALETEAMAARSWRAIPASSSGYIQSVATEALLALARDCDAVVRMDRAIGEFVVEGEVLASISSNRHDPEDLTRRLNALYVIGEQRSVHQDAGFGIRQIVDIALKALSPGINDATTAVMCIDYLSAILVRVATRRIATPYRTDGTTLRVIARGPRFETMLDEAFTQIRQNGEGNPAVIERLLLAVEIIAGRTASARRLEALARHARACSGVAIRTIRDEDRTRIDEVSARIAAKITQEKGAGFLP